jgi:mannose-6-phosphate isomerase-like protein (cupin superfamily)
MGRSRHIVDRVHVPEARVEATGDGLVRKTEGWYVVNAREMRWLRWPGLGFSSNFGGDILFDQLGIGLTVLGPGEPMSMYHWETDEEDFLVLSGEATLIIEGQERPLRAWDFVHCPPGTRHVIVGGPCVVLGVGSRERHTIIGPDGKRTGRPGASEYVPDPVAKKHGAAPDEATESAEEAYARFPKRVFTRYGGWLDSR